MKKRVISLLLGASLSINPCLQAVSVSTVWHLTTAATGLAVLPETIDRLIPVQSRILKRLNKRVFIPHDARYGKAIHILLCLNGLRSFHQLLKNYKQYKKAQNKVSIQRKA